MKFIIFATLLSPCICAAHSAKGSKINWKIWLGTMIKEPIAIDPRCLAYVA